MRQSLAILKAHLVCLQLRSAKNRKHNSTCRRSMHWLYRTSRMTSSRRDKCRQLSICQTSPSLSNEGSAAFKINEKLSTNTGNWKVCGKKNQSRGFGSYRKSISWDKLSDITRDARQWPLGRNVLDAPNNHERFLYYKTVEKLIVFLLYLEWFQLLSTLLE